MATSKQIWGLGPKNILSAVLLLGCLGPECPSSPTSLAKSPPLRPDSQSTSSWKSLQAPFPLAHGPGAASTRFPLSQHRFLWDTQTWKERTRHNGLSLPLGQGLQSVLFVYNQQVGGEWTSLWCGRRGSGHKSRTHGFHAWEDFSWEAGPLQAPSPIRTLSLGFYEMKKQNESEKYFSLLNMIPTDISLFVVIKPEIFLWKCSWCIILC